MKARRPRAWSFLVAAAVSLGLLTAGAPADATIPADATTQPGSPLHAVTSTHQGQLITGGVMFGGTLSLVKDESRLGRKLAIVRGYYHFGERFPTRGDAAAMAGHRTLLVSLDAKRNTPGYAAVAAGDRDRYIRSFLRSMNRAAIQHHLGVIYFCYEHEAELNHGMGTPAQFREAWRHIRHLAREAHLSRLRFVFTLLHWAFVRPQPRWIRVPSATALWPGHRQVDLVAADGYYSPGCKNGSTLNSYGNVTPYSVFGPLLSFGRLHRKPVVIAEWGASAKYPRAQARFIHEMGSYVSAHPQIRAASYWDQTGSHCSYRVDSHPRALTALRAMGQLDALQGHVIW
jgi:hypothetical protein